MRPPSLNPFRIISLHKHRGGALLALQTFNLELSTFDLLQSSPLFSLCYTLFSATGLPQPFVHQSLPHSCHRDGGCTPPYCLRRREVQGLWDVTICFRAIPFLFMPLRTLLQFLAFFRTYEINNYFLFMGLRTLRQKKNRGWGPAAWSPKNKMIYLPNPLSSLTAVNCPLLTTRQKAEPSRLAVLVPVTGLPRPCRGHKSPVTVRRPRNTDSLFQFMDSRGTI